MFWMVLGLHAAGYLILTVSALWAAAHNAAAGLGLLVLLLIVLVDAPHRRRGYGG